MAGGGGSKRNHCPHHPVVEAQLTVSHTLPIKLFSATVGGTLDGHNNNDRMRESMHSHSQTWSYQIRPAVADASNARSKITRSNNEDIFRSIDRLWQLVSLLLDTDCLSSSWHIAFIHCLRRPALLQAHRSTKKIEEVSIPSISRSPPRDTQFHRLD
jgi:hypothetical protein